VADNKDDSRNPNSEFLQQLDAALAAKVGVDGDLRKILSTHILQTVPSGDCVAHARKAIADLAIARASSKTEA